MWTKTLRTGRGICFDYASLTAAMLRSQNIPARLEIGYSGDVYHAWISVYTEETGWIDRLIEFFRRRLDPHGSHAGRRKRQQQRRPEIYGRRFQLHDTVYPLRKEPYESFK